MPKIEFSLREVAEAFDSKIRLLQTYKQDLESSLRTNPSSTVNQQTLEKINESLCYAKGARKLMEDCCCSVYICNFDHDL